MGPDYPTGIAEYFDEAVRGHAPLRTLQDPASSSSFQSDRLSWREYLGQVKHLSDIEALREHDSGWLRLMNRAFTSQLNSITASTFPSFSAGKRHRRARPSGKRYAGKRRPKRKANQNDAAPDVD
ncbi:hypothetical protein Pmar_PMAR019014 [Perkinsus marinus ATCC 50983]|uniref:Uncharacterized protein n=1 Tax=Perkinsus marinus (strain ATCC 50983 / TXsc) TaxID=423536 RepID=C5KY29_PERM5|nr:hypothetical protein Pmar_PMAR019014 [Perkinsus marinus ATCC 50983]EER10636.1 hypothetical protein Pmar_PMAR019014 [Perkinsus marinus ATCC 50983]|eukprot:XP_002778841.1 hypothetical protein Pmar_PMAR019014 [Perkinsus marinus ATCC 50983]